MAHHQFSFLFFQYRYITQSLLMPPHRPHCLLYLIEGLYSALRFDEPFLYTTGRWGTLLI